jgi:hypothetical protein
MKKTKLIIVAGMSGVGKSTSAQNISYQLTKNAIPHEWYHEEMKDHPIRWAEGGEFTAGDRNTEEGMELNILDTFSRWEALIEKMITKGGVFVMEGCLYQNIIRYFIPGGYPREKIFEYYQHLLKILEPANPHIIHLYRPDVKISFRKAFEVRGKNWEKIITESQENYDFTDEIAYQTLAREVFAGYPGKKLSIDTSEDQWTDYLQQMCDFLDIHYHHKQYASVENPEKYVGIYTKGNAKVTIIYKDHQLYCSPPWFTHIKMNPVKEDEFELTAFPINFKFSFRENETCLSVTGNYDWQIVGKTLKARTISKEEGPDV